MIRRKPPVRTRWRLWRIGRTLANVRAQEQSLLRQLDYLHDDPYIGVCLSVWDRISEAEKELDQLRTRSQTLLTSRKTLLDLVAPIDSGKPSSPLVDELRPTVMPGWIDPLRILRWLVTRSDRQHLDLVREDLQDDFVEMYAEGHRSRLFFLAVMWWRSMTEFAPFFWRGVRRLLPFKKVGWEGSASEGAEM